MSNRTWKIVAAAAAGVLVFGAGIGIGLMGLVVSQGTDDATPSPPDDGYTVLDYDDSWNLYADVWNGQSNADRQQTCEAVEFFGVDSWAEALAGDMLREDVVVDVQAVEDVYTEACEL